VPIGKHIYTDPMNRPERPPAKNKFTVFGTPWPLDPPLLRVRLRYITARFLQMPEPRISLRNTDEILRWAQQLMDDGMSRSATELVRLAIEEDPDQRNLWRFLTACAFEDENATEFSDLSQAFAVQFPNDEAMAEIQAMERQLLRRSSNISATGSYVSPARQRSSAFFGRDGVSQRELHESLVRLIVAQQAR